MDKNEREKSALYEWGVKNNLRYQFQGINKTQDSYFVERKRGTIDTYIREYNFETLPEFMRELDTMWENEDVMQEIKKPLGVAIIKNKPNLATPTGDDTEKINEKRADQKNENKLPVYIYNF